jgi:hypothetical protein
MRAGLRIAVATLVIALGHLLLQQSASSISQRNQPEPERQRATDKSVDQWIEQLASDDSDIREKAAHELVQRKDAFVPLHHACQSNDAEVRRLAADCVQKLRETLKRKALDSLKSLAKNGEVDLFIDRFVALRSDLRDEDWQTALELARDIADRAHRTTKKDVKLPDIAFMTFPIIHPADVTADVTPGFGCRRVATIGFPHGRAPGHDIFRSFAICQDKVVMHMVIGQSVVFTIGSIVVVNDSRQANIRGSIVFSDGDVETDNIYNSVVIASGSVKVNRTEAESVVIQNDQHPLAFVKRFTLAKAGLALKSTEEGLEVTQVIDGGPFARAGLRTGDRILAVDRENPKTVEEFRKLVRRNALPFRVISLLISRQGVRLKLLVHLDL